MNKATVKRHVRIRPATLSHLFNEDYLETAFKSDPYTWYRLTGLGRTVAVRFEAQKNLWKYVIYDKDGQVVLQKNVNDLDAHTNHRSLPVGFTLAH